MVDDGAPVDPAGACADKPSEGAEPLKEGTVTAVSGAQDVWQSGPASDPAAPFPVRAAPEKGDTAAKAPLEASSSATPPAGLLPEGSLGEALAQERIDIFLLLWLTRAEGALAKGDTRESKAFVSYVLCLCGAPDGDVPEVWRHVASGRGVRRIAARCIAQLYATEAAKPPLYDVFAALQDTLQDMRGDRLAAQLAALEVALALVRKHASAAGMPDLLSLCLRLARSHAVVVVRAHALALLAAVLPAQDVGAHAKELYKQLRQLLADKAGPVVRGAAACLEVLRDVHDVLRARSETEAHVVLAFKVSAAADTSTRTALAELAAALLAQHVSDEAPLEPLAMLQHHLAKASTWQTRDTVVGAYAAVLARCGAAWLEAHYVAVFDHIATGLATHMAQTLPPCEVGYLRRALGRLVRTSLCAPLAEPAAERVAAALGTHVLSAWPPATPAATPPSEAALVLALEASATLVSQLGDLSAALRDALYACHVQLLTHAAPAVQERAAFWLRVACNVQPQLLAPTYTSLLQYMRRDVAALSTTQPDRGVSLRTRLAGNSYALAVLAPVAAAHPLYVQNDDVEDVLVLALELLQRGGEHALTDATAAVSAAWALVGSLMALGPAFVRPHVPTLLRLWRNALAPPGEVAGQAAWAFLCTVRDGALGSVEAFFVHGGAALLTPETARRIAAMLHHTFAFVEALFADELLASARAPLLRARLFRVAVQLSDSPALDVLQRQLVSEALASFARAERYVGSATQAAVSASAFQQLWTLHDGYAYGATSLLGGAVDGPAAWARGAVPQALGAPPAHESLVAALEADAHTPVVGALENDASALYCDASAALPAPPPAATAEVDAAIEMFGALFAYQERELQVGAAEFLLHSVHAPLDKNPGRRAALLANAVAALLGAVRTAMHGTRRAAGFANDRVNTAVRQVAQQALLQGDVFVRRAGAELYGRLAVLAGSASLTTQVQFLVEQVVDNRRADSRAACAAALGEVYSRVGGLNASPLTRTVSCLLLSLAGDPHPGVHYSALDALARVVEAASLAYAPYVSGTLGLLARLYAAPTHEPDGGSAGSANLRVGLPAYAGIARVVGALVGVLGPELRESVSKRKLVCALLFELARETDPSVACDALSALQRLGLVAPDVLATRAWAELLRGALASAHAPLARAAAAAYYQMAQCGTAWLAQYGGRALLQTLLTDLERDAVREDMAQVLTAWVRHSAHERPTAWVDLCQGVLAGGGGEAAAAAADDDEEAALGPQAAPEVRAVSWRTQLFVLRCVHEVFAAVGESRAPHTGAASDARQPQLLSSRTGDLIKMAFNASTAPHRAVRAQGLEVLRDVIAAFATTPDPEFADQRLLAQFQAPIAAALTPAFGADSSPEVLAAAVDVCAVYVAAGVADVSASRVVRVLTAARLWLEADAHAPPEADAPARAEADVFPGLLLTPNAAAYLRLAVLRAWARMAIAGDVLAPLLAPHVAPLARAWLTTLAEYAQLRADPNAPAEHVLPRLRADSALAALVRMHTLAHLDGQWTTLLHALAAVLERDADVVLAAGAADAFLPLYGLALETLCAALERRSHADRHAQRVVLVALPVLVDVRLSGEFFVHGEAFDELAGLFARAFAIGDDVSLQLGVLRVARTLVHTLRERLLETEDGYVDDDALAATKLGRLVRLVLAWARQLPCARGACAARAAALHAALGALVDMAEVCSVAVQQELVAVLLYEVVELAQREDDAPFLLTGALPVLRSLAQRACVAAGGSAGGTAMHRVVQGFFSALLDMADAMRARAGEVVERKSSNALVGVSLVLTTLDARVLVSSEVAERLGFLLSHKLDADVASVLPCVRSIVSAAAAGAAGERPALRSLRLCLGSVLPALVAYAVRHVEHDTPEAAQAVATLQALVDAVPDDAVGALCIALPVFVRLVARVPPAPHKRAVCAVLVDTARRHAAAFKSATAALPEADRAQLHDALRESMGVGPARAPKAGSSISLRTFGAG